MAHNRGCATYMGTDVATNGTSEHARGHAFRDVGNCDSNAPSFAENFDRVERARITRTGRPQINPAVGGTARGEIRP